jgi:iron complex transport system substrate-binding protein
MICRYCKYLAIILCILPLSAHAVIRVIDDYWHKVVVDKPAKRIISLSPAVTELLFAAGAGSAVIGAVEYSDYPVMARHIPRVGRHDRLDMEKILSLQPDLLVAWGSGGNQHTVEKLTSLGFPLYVSEPRRLKDIPATILKFGQLAGTREIAEKTAQDFKQRYDRLVEKYSRQHVISVFYQIWDEPLVSIGGKHIISDVISVCGGKNVFNNVQSLAPTLSIEAVLQADPQVILVSSDIADARPVIQNWQHWSGLQAVSRSNLLIMPSDLMQRSGPRLIEAAELLCEQLDQVRKRSEH